MYWSRWWVSFPARLLLSSRSKKKSHSLSVVIILLVKTNQSRAWRLKKTMSKLDTLEFIILRQQSKILLCLDFSRVYMISTNCMNSLSAYLDNGRYFRYFMLIPTHHRFSFTIYIYIYKHKKQCQIYSNLLFSAVIASCYYMCMNI